MTIARKLYEEYVALEQKYRRLGDQWKADGGILTTKNLDERKQIVELGRKVEAKLEELNDALGIRRLER